MSIQFVKKLDENKVIENVNNRIKIEKFNYQLWKTIEKACEKFEGKKITKRIQTEIEKVLPEYNVYYENAYGMFHLKIWGNGISYNDVKSFLLGYESDPIFTMEHFRYYSQWAELEEGRAAKLESLDINELKKNVKTWNDALDTLQSIHKWAEKYEIQYMSDGFDLNVR